MGASLAESGRQHLLHIEGLKLNNQFILGLRLPGCPADEHLQEGDSDGPEVALVAVLVVGERLEGHVERRTDILFGRMLAFFDADGEPEVRDLHFLLEVEQDVAGLDIAVDEALGVDRSIPMDYLFEEAHCSALLEFALSAQDLAEGAPLAELGDDVDAVLGLDHMLQLEQVAVSAQGLQRLDLGLGHLDLFGAAVLELGDDLDGDELFCMWGDILVFS